MRGGSKDPTRLVGILGEEVDRSLQGKDSARRDLAESGRVWEKNELGGHGQGFRESPTKRRARGYSGSRGERRQAVSRGSPGDVGAPARCAPFPSCCSFWISCFSRLSPQFVLRSTSSSPQYEVAGIDFASRFSPLLPPSISHLSLGKVCRARQSHDMKGVSLAAVVRRAVRVLPAQTDCANTVRSYSPLSPSAHSFVSISSPRSGSLPVSLVELSNWRNFSFGGKRFVASSFALLKRRVSSFFISSRAFSRCFVGAPSCFLLLSIYLLLFYIVSSPYRHSKHSQTAFCSPVDSVFPLPSFCPAPPTLFSPVLLGVSAGSLQPPPVSFSRPLRRWEFVNDLSSESLLSVPSSRRMFRSSDPFLQSSPNRSSSQTKFSTGAISGLSLLSSSLSSFLYPFSSSYLSISKPLREHSAAYSSLPIISPSARLPGGGAVITNQSRPHPSFSRSLVSPAFAWRSLNRARSSLFSLSSFCRGRPESLGYLASRELISSCASPCSPLAKEPSLSFLSVSLSTPHFSSLVGSPSVGANRTSTAFEDTLTSCGFTRDAVPGARSFISCRAEGVSALPRPPKRSREEISSKVLSYPTARPVQSEKSETSGHQQGVAFQRMGELSKELRREEGNQSGHSESFRVSNDRMTSKRQLEERGFASLHQRFARRSVPPLLPKPSHSISKHKGLCNLLSAVNLPCDLKRLPLQSLPQLCEEIRQEILRVVSQVGGHLASSLGMVEVIVALLRVLDVPTDRIVYDVSHQAYPHKMLTGRRHLMGSLRRSGGISGFCKRSESIYDAFGAGHSSTSISSIQGMTVAWQVLHEAARGSAKRRLHVAVIGDGGLTGGMAYEALNACGYLRTPVLVLLNDNQQVSLPTGTASAGGTAPASAVSRHMEKLLKARDFLSLKSVSRNGETPVRGTGLLENGDGAESRRRQCEDILDAQEREGEDENGDSHSQVDSSFFEALGFEYLGPVDGHDVENLVAVLSDLKRSGLKGPTVLHVKTEKGHGYPPALEAADRLHGVTPGFSDTLKLVRPPLEASFKKKQCGTNPSLYTPQQRISQSTAALHRLQSGQVSPADSNCRTSGSHQQNQSSTDQTTSSTLEGTPQSTQNLSPHAGLLGGTSLVSSSQKSASSGSVSRPSFTSIAARALLRLAEVDERVVGVTAAMPGGTGLHMMGSKFPRRMFDVGIAEQHAVTFAAGMASEGLKPFCAIYSTFLQRAYDQIVHDAALQKLPVRFLIDRAGYVGPDGSTHHGTFDLAFLGCLPDLVVMAPSDELELLHMVETAYQYEKGPSAVRYPRSSCYGIATLNNFLGHSVTEMPQRGKALEVGKGRIVKKAKPHAKHKVAILSLGTRLLEAVQAAQMLEEGPTGPSSSSVPEDSGGTPSTRVVTLSDDTSISIAPTSHHCKQMSSGWSDSREITSGQGNAGDKRRNACHENEVGVTVADARFLAPLDLELLRQLAADHEALLVVEEGSEGGFGSHVLKALTDEAMLDAGTLKVRSLTMPRRFMEAGTQQQQYEDAGLTAPHFARVIRSLIQS